MSADAVEVCALEGPRVGDVINEEGERLFRWKEAVQQQESIAPPASLSPDSHPPNSTTD